jgi:hypothetical protein
MLLALKGRADAEHRELKARYVQAHAIAAWSGFGKPPDIGPFLDKLDAAREPPRPQTGEEILAAWAAWSAYAKTLPPSP